MNATYAVESHVVEYDIIAAMSTSELILAVNAAIKKGWQPFGAPYTIRVYDRGFEQTQAMVKIKNRI